MRNLSSTAAAQIAAGVCAPVLFVVAEFANETFYLFGGVGSITPTGPAYNPLSTFPYDETWMGLGWLAKISNIPGTTKVQAQNITLSLAGIPAELVSEAIGQVRITGSATVFIGWFNMSTWAVIPDPIQVFQGALDVPTLDDAGDTCTLNITCENTLISLQEAPGRQFDDMDQQIYAPGDLGFSFVDALPNLSLYWPSPSSYNSSAFPVTFEVITGAGADIAVGGTVTIYVKMTYSDGSYYTLPGPSGSGQSWFGSLASSNPAIATVNESGVVTGVSPGECTIIVSAVYPIGGTPIGSRRTSCTIIVHN